MVAHAYKHKYKTDTQVWEERTAKSWSQPGLHSEFLDSLCYTVKPSTKLSWKIVKALSKISKN